MAGRVYTLGGVLRRIYSAAPHLLHTSSVYILRLDSRSAASEMCVCAHGEATRYQDHRLQVHGCVHRETRDSAGATAMCSSSRHPNAAVERGKNEADKKGASHTAPAPTSLHHNHEVSKQSPLPTAKVSYVTISLSSMWLDVQCN
jgi:hypothetical protein